MSLPPQPDPVTIIVNNEAPFEPRVEKTGDPVNPTHYASLGLYSAIHVIEKWGLGYHVGNAVKYVQRAGKKLYDGKDAVESELIDLKKARWYMQRRIHQLDPENEPDPAVPDDVIAKRYRF